MYAKSGFKMTISLKAVCQINGNLKDEWEVLTTFQSAIKENLIQQSKYEACENALIESNKN